MLKITRKNDSRVVKSILNRVADIPGGVTVSIATLGGSCLYEGTPIGAQDASTGLCKVVKTAKMVTQAANDATTYEVAKGHHFKVGDLFTEGVSNAKAITAIDKTTNTDKDVITLATTLGAVVNVGVVCYEAAGANTTIAVTPVAIVGSNYDVEALEQLFVDAWLIAVVKSSVAPWATTGIKTALKGIFYI